MKRKQTAKTEVVVAPEILEGAKRMATMKPPVKCVVCGSEAIAGPAEQLCWVCRRLKISAWRDAEQQMPAQE